jgi:hypothetical protein
MVPVGTPAKRRVSESFMENNAVGERAISTLMADAEIGPEAGSVMAAS